jgi:ABC-type oligopeptide transport system ATPase subunit
VLSAPQHAYTRSLLAAVPTMRTDRERPLAVAQS